MLGGTGFCSWVAFVPRWETAKGRVCVNAKTRIGLHGNSVSSLGFCGVPWFQLHAVEEGCCLAPAEGGCSFSSFQWKLDSGPSILETVVIVGSVVWIGSELFFCLGYNLRRLILSRSVAVPLLTLKLVIMTSAFLKGWGWDANNAFNYHMQRAIKPY